nr:hypothetical protein [Curtobacterium flaccumfaciens]
MSAIEGMPQTFALQERDAVEPECREHLVADAELGVEDPEPDQGGDDVRHQVRREHDAAHEGRLGQAVHHHGDEQRDDGLDDDVDEDVLDGHHHRVPEDRVLHQAGVVLQAGELGLGEQVVRREAQVDAPHGRPGEEHREPDGCRGDEDEREPQVVPGAAPWCGGAGTVEVGGPTPPSRAGGRQG